MLKQTNKVLWFYWDLFMCISYVDYFLFLNTMSPHLTDYRITVLTIQMDQKLSPYTKRCESDAWNTSKWCEMIYYFYKKEKLDIYRFYACRELIRNISKICTIVQLTNFADLQIWDQLRLKWIYFDSIKTKWLSTWQLKRVEYSLITVLRLTNKQN